MSGGKVTPAMVTAAGEYNEADQHERASAARRLVLDDIHQGRAPIPTLITTSLACACQPCIDGSVEQASELGDWILPSAVQRFVAQCCELSPSARVTPAELLAAYLGWAHGAGEDTAVTQVGFGRALSARLGVRTVAASGMPTYRGIGLRR